VRRVRELISHQDKLLDLYYDDGVSKEVLQAQQKRLAAEQAQAQRLADAAELEVSDLDQALSDALLLIDERLMPYASGSGTEKRLVNLAIFVMLLVSESGEIEIQATPLYAELVPLARELGRDAAQSTGDRPRKGRGPDFRGHGLKTTKMAERAGFEPAMEFDPHTRLAGECLQPLGHLSRVGERRSLEAAWRLPTGAPDRAQRAEARASPARCDRKRPPGARDG
jgi:hypothetical protein